MKQNYLSGLLLVLASFVMIVAGCTKEGPAGLDGKDGNDGVNGVDASAECKQCHNNSQNINVKVLQWESSYHATGGAYSENSTSCAPCHTSQGFLERMAADTTANDAVIEDPLPPNCYTCHKIHDTYSSDDLALTYADPVVFWMNPYNEAASNFGSGNLCSNCHQSRVSAPFPTVGSAETYTITSFRYGPHHGPMSNMLAGVGGYRVDGSLTYENHPHSSTPNGCVWCHMGTYNAEEKTGGHNMAANIADNCNLCHTDDIETKTEAMQFEIDSLLNQLGTVLAVQGIRNPDTDYLAGDNGGNASSDNPANLTANELGCWYNYKFVQEDKSGGVHNYTYAKALLTNSLQALSK